MNKYFKPFLLACGIFSMSLGASPDAFAGRQYVRDGQPPAEAGKKLKPRIAMMNRKAGESSLFKRSERINVVAPSLERVKTGAASAGDNIFTGIVYEAGDYRLGYGLLNPNTGAWTPKVEDGVAVQSIGFSEDRNEVYTLAYNVYADGIGEISSNVYDFSTGEKKSTRVITTEAEFSSFPIYGAYDEEENSFYGYANAGWVKWDMSSMSGTVLKQYSSQEANQNLTPSFCFDYNRSSFVGIVFDGTGSEVVLIDKSNGHTSTLGATSTGSGYIGGMCYDSSMGRYIWNPNDDNTSEIVAINASDFEVTKLYKFPTVVETGCMFLPEMEVAAAPDAPEMPEFISGSFPDGARTGEISFRLPEKLNNGTSISGQVDYSVSVVGKEIATGKAAAGSMVTTPVGESADLPQGSVTFKITAELNGKKSNICKGTVWIGYDTPVPPTNVKLTPAQVTWDAVTEGVHGGYVDPADVYYTVSLNGEVVADYVTGTTSVSGLTLTSPLDTYIATVTATNHGLTSLPGKSNDITFGEPKGEPFYIEPTEDEFNKCVIFNVNNDTDFSGAERTWRFDEWSGYGNAFTCNDNWQTDSDDWLFLPPVNIKNTANLHRFSMQAWCAEGEWSPDKLDIYLCDSPDPNASTKIPISTDLLITADNYKPGQYSFLFNISNPGNYYIGIHNKTSQGWYSVCVNNIHLDVTDLDNNSAGAVTDLTATPADKGELNATIAFKLPATTIGGYSLSSDVTATIVSPAETLTVSGAPGSEQSLVIKTTQSTEEEDNLITVTTSSNGKPGDSADVRVYTGVVVPAAPNNIRMEIYEDNMGGVLKWDAPTSALNVYDGYIGDEFEYTVCRLIPGYIEEVWEPIKNIGNATEFSISLPEGTNQMVRSYGVIASNAAGCGGKMIMNDRYFSRDEKAMAGRNFVLGKLYDLPAIEDITPENVSSQTLPYQPMTFNKLTGQGYFETPSLLNNSDWPLDSYPSPTGSAMMLKWQPGRGSGSARGEITLPKFSLEGKNKVSFMPSFYLPTIDNLEIGVRAYGMEEAEIIADFSSIIGGETTGWNDMAVTFPEKYANAPWVEIVLYPTFKTYDHMMFFLNGFKLMNMVPYDLAAVSVNAPKDAEQGSDFKITATATNYGTQEIRSYTATLFANDEEIAKQTGSNVKSLASTNITFDCTMPAIATRSILYKVVFECTDDADESNNTSSTIIVTPTESRLPKATELQAEMNEAGVVLTWLKPDATSIPGDPVTDDFEDAESFAAQYGDWVFVDVDDSPWGGIQGVQIPNVTPGETKGSFMTWDNDILNGVGTESHSGTKSLFAFFRYDYGESDDWAISPELSGDAQTVSFYAKSYNAGEAHNVEVWYSDGSVKPEDFTKATLIGPSVVPAEWTQIKAQIPEGAKRFAIRNITQGGFLLFVDDVTYVPAGTPSISLELKGYDVYRNGLKINSEPVATNAYEDENVTKNESYSYVVTVLYDKGVSGPSDPATIKVSGVDQFTNERSIVAGRGYIRISGFEGEDVIVSTPDGKVMASGKSQSVNTIYLPAGIYVVKAGARTTSVIVK